MWKRRSIRSRRTGVGHGCIYRGRVHSLKLERRLVGDLAWTSLVQGGLDDVMIQRALHEFMRCKSLHIGIKASSIWIVAPNLNYEYIVYAEADYVKR